MITNLFSTILAAPPAGQPSDIRNPALGDLMTRFTGAGGGAAFLGALVTLIITVLLVAGSIYFVIQLLLGGYRWISSGGDKTQLEEARGTLTSALIGLILLFSTWAIITLIGNVFGINLLLFEVPTL